MALPLLLDASPLRHCTVPARQSLRMASAPAVHGILRGKLKHTACMKSACQRTDVCLAATRSSAHGLTISLHDPRCDHWPLTSRHRAADPRCRSSKHVHALALASPDGWLHLLGSTARYVSNLRQLLAKDKGLAGRAGVCVDMRTLLRTVVRRIIALPVVSPVRIYSLIFAVTQRPASIPPNIAPGQPSWMLMSPTVLPFQARRLTMTGIFRLVVKMVHWDRLKSSTQATIRIMAAPLIRI